MPLTGKKFALFAAGIFTFTFGIVLTLHSGLGISPFDALLVGLFRTIGLTIGSWEIILGLLMILFNAAAVRRRPAWSGMLTAFFIGGCIDLWVFLLEGSIAPESWPARFAIFFTGLAFNGIGIATYLRSKLAPVPFDGTMLVIQELTRLSLVYSRAILMIVLVVLAFLFHGPIGIGTILITFMSGVMIQLFTSGFDKLAKQRMPTARSNRRAG